MKLGSSFAPIVLLWFLFNVIGAHSAARFLAAAAPDTVAAAVNIYNINKCRPHFSVLLSLAAALLLEPAAVVCWLQQLCSYASVLCHSSCC